MAQGPMQPYMLQQYCQPHNVLKPDQILVGNAGHFYPKYDLWKGRKTRVRAETWILGVSDNRLL